jgi:hypothetical protein
MPADRSACGLLRTSTRVGDVPDHNRIQSCDRASEWTHAPIEATLGDHEDGTDRASVTSPLLRAAAWCTWSTTWEASGSRPACPRPCDARRPDRPVGGTRSGRATSAGLSRGTHARPCPRGAAAPRASASYPTVPRLLVASLTRAIRSRVAKRVSRRSNAVNSATPADSPSCSPAASSRLRRRSISRVSCARSVIHCSGVSGAGAATAPGYRHADARARRTSRASGSSRPPRFR